MSPGGMSKSSAGWWVLARLWAKSWVQLRRKQMVWIECASDLRDGKCSSENCISIPFRMTWLPSLSCNKAQSTFCSIISMNHHCSMQGLCWTIAAADSPTQMAFTLSWLHYSRTPALWGFTQLRVSLPYLVSQSASTFFPSLGCVTPKPKDVQTFFTKWESSDHYTLPALLPVESTGKEVFPTGCLTHKNEGKLGHLLFSPPSWLHFLLQRVWLWEKSKNKHPILSPFASFSLASKGQESRREHTHKR